MFDDRTEDVLEELQQEEGSDTDEESVNIDTKLIILNDSQIRGKDVGHIIIM